MKEHFWIVAFAGIVILAAVVGCMHGAAVVERDFANYRAQQQAARESAALALLDKQTEWQHTGDVLSDQLEAARLHLDEVKQEKQRVIYRTKTVTVDRPCLGADAVRLLNGSRTGLQLSDTTGGTAADTATGVASDTDVAIWAADAQQRYAECSARLAALIDWHRLVRGM